ncbi:MAG: outer membrane lipid asymmetry maintenance protein MlaD [Proteobacteria bacterium]|nr:outer membrane lipid asymmetry maintenance protein MlaD [Burkholderiales bacterium]
MERSRLDVWVGVFVLGGLAALLILALKVGNAGDMLGRGDTYTLTAQFENIGGLKPKAAVRSAGVVVGRVATIDYDPETFNAIVVFKIDQRFSRFPVDTFASVYTTGLLGEQYVALAPGGDEKLLVDGARITKTQKAVVLEDLIGQFLTSRAGESSTQ